MVDVSRAAISTRCVNALAATDGRDAENGAAVPIAAKQHLRRARIAAFRNITIGKWHRI
jgi:hypothetical protein